MDGIEFAALDTLQHGLPRDAEPLGGLIDEAALREGLPLRKSQWKDYLDWAAESFRIAANGVADETQIHTHMCYSDGSSLGAFM